MYQPSWAVQNSEVVNQSVQLHQHPLLLLPSNRPQFIFCWAFENISIFDWTTQPNLKCRGGVAPDISAVWPDSRKMCKKVKFPQPDGFLQKFDSRFLSRHLRLGPPLKLQRYFLPRLDIPLFTVYTPDLKRISLWISLNMLWKSDCQLHPIPMKPCACWNPMSCRQLSWNRWPVSDRGWKWQSSKIKWHVLGPYGLSVRMTWDPKIGNNTLDQFPTWFWVCWFFCHFRTYEPVRGKICGN